MMALKRKGVLAKPGEYTYGDVTETKTAKELQAAVERQPIIMLTQGHPTSGFPSASDFIGTVSQSWDDETNSVLGDFWFYEESVPMSVRRKLEHHEPVPISAGFAIDDVVDGEQKGIIYTHIAVLEEEEPVCPLDQCGVNVRQETSSMPDMRYEEKQDITDPEAEAETEKSEETTEETSEPQGPTVAELQVEIAELKEQVSDLREEETDEPSAEQEPEAEKSESNQEQDTKEPEPEPEQVIPAGTPAKQYSHLTKNDDGTISWEMPSEEET